MVNGFSLVLPASKHLNKDKLQQKMPFSTAFKFVKKYLWLLPLIAITIAYIPLLVGFMSIKNDSCVLSYPIFYFFSTQLQQGIIPFWHFNMHFGFALLADPGTPFLNPLFWMFAFLGSSINIYVLYILLHLFIGGYGMFLLSKQLGFEFKTSTILSVAYIAGGYFVSHLQHANGIIESAYLPFVINFLYALYKKPTLKNAIWLGIFFYLITVSGYPGFAIGMPYYIIILGVGYLLTHKFSLAFTQYKKAGLLFILSIIIAAILCLPFLYTLFSNIENFQRGSIITDERYLHEGGTSPLIGFISLLFPLASVVQNSPFASSDISWNNIFIGLVPFIFFIAAIRLKQIRGLLPHILIVLFFLDISFEGQIKQLFFKLPLFNFLRYNGGLRIYAMLSMLIIAGTVLHNYFTNSKNVLARLQIIIKILLIIVGSIFFITLIIGIINHTLTINIADGLVKSILHIGFTPAILLQSGYVIIMLWIIKKLLFYQKRILFIALVDIIFCFWVNLPFTGLSIKSMPSIQQDITTSMQYIDDIKGYNILSKDVQQPAINHVVYAPALTSNHIGFIPLHAYPSGKKTYFSFVEKNGEAYFNHRGVCYLASDTSTALSYKINAANMTIECNTQHSDTLYIHQNFDKNWTAQTQNKSVEITSWQNTFMQIVLPANTQNVILKYNDSIANKLLILPIIGLIAIIVYLSISYFKNNKENI